MRKEKGITLMVLAITIIVLLILVSVSINALKGSNGIIDKANDASELADVSTEKDIIMEAVTYARGMNKRGKLVASELQTKLNSATGDGKTVVSEINDEIQVKFVDSERTYNIDTNGNIEKK